MSDTSSLQRIETPTMNYFEGNEVLAPSSIIQYNSKLIKWISLMPKDKQDILHVLLYPNESITYLTQLDNTNNTNLHTYYVAIKSYLQHTKYLYILINKDTLQTLKDTWTTIITNNQAPMVHRRLQQKPTELQEKKGGTKLTYQDIVKKRDELQKGSISKLLLAFYTYLPPVRADYGSVAIVHGEEETTSPNYIRMLDDSHAVCILTEFKTAKRYKKIENTLPDALFQELQASLLKQPRTHLFVNQSQKPFTRNAFTVWTKRILSKLFDTQLTLVIVRHLFLSSLDYDSLSVEELVELGNKMGHSIQMQRGYVWKSGSGEDEDEEEEEEEEDKESSSTKKVGIRST
jgi:hypothetical protein